MSPPCLTVASLALLSCSAPRPSEPAGGPEVLLRAPGRPPARVRVEVARSAPDRARGLMHRERLDEDRGMLFVFEGEAVRSFWMKNTLLPLDMIFIGQDRRVVGVVENAEPLTLASRSVGVPSRYVLEVNAGFAALHGVRAGTTVEFINLEEGAPR